MQVPQGARRVPAACELEQSFSGPPPFTGKLLERSCQASTAPVGQTSQDDDNEECHRSRAGQEAPVPNKPRRSGTKSFNGMRNGAANASKECAQTPGGFQLCAQVVGNDSAVPDHAEAVEEVCPLRNLLK